MTTAAEALEKVLQVMMEPRIMELATIRAGENCNKHNIAATIRTAVDEALRAALAAPQAVEVEPRKVMQTEFGVDGNCQSACIATITGIPLDAIPNFTKLGKTDLQRRQAMCEWLWAHGWGIVTFVASDTEIRRWYPGFVIAGGESARGIYHGVVYKDGELWHDPHPDGTGLTKVEDCDILYRLLRATQSNGHSPENPATGRLQHRPDVASASLSKPGSARCGATGGQIDGESPTQQAKPVAKSPRGVMQTEFGADGNCQSACIATITGLPLEAVPNFTKLGKTDLQRRQAMCEWLWAHGWGIVTFVASLAEIKRWYPGYVIAGGESSRGVYHGVVYKDGELWHDPHPDGTGLTKVEDCDILYRLLRATQSNGRLAVDGRGSFPGEGSTPSQSRYPKAGSTPAGGESPAQSAPAQEPVAWAWFHRGQVNFDGSDALRELDDLKATPIPLYAAPQPDEARELLRRAISLAYDPRETRERIRAYLESKP